MYSASRCYDGQSQVTIPATFESNSTSVVHSLAVSPDGKLLALGDDAGVLEIREYRPSGWRQVRLYGGVGRIRAISWSPSEQRTVFIGSERGDIQRITLPLDLDQPDTICHGNVEGFVHALAVSRSGKIIIAYGHYVGVVDHPFEEDPTHLSDPVPLLLEMVQQGGEVRDLPHIRHLHFLDEETVLLTYANRNGIHAYSTRTWQQLWSMEMRNTMSRIGSAALSPTGERMAVANLSDGVDWYSVSHRKYAMTTQFGVTDNQGRNPIVGITFVDDDTVAVGHADGLVIFATYGFPRGVDHVLCASPGSGTAIRTLAFGYVAGSPSVFAIGISLNRAQRPLIYCAKIHGRYVNTTSNASSNEVTRQGGFWPFMSILALATATGYAFFGLRGLSSTIGLGGNYAALDAQPQVAKTSTLVQTTTVTRPASTTVYTKTITAPVVIHTTTPIASTVTFTKTSCNDMTYAPIPSTITYTKTDYSTKTKTVHGASGANAMQCVCTFSGSLQAIPGVPDEITIGGQASDID